MKEFALIFRHVRQDYIPESPKEIQAVLEKWQGWMKNLEQQGRLTGVGARLATEGKVLKEGGVITDGPFVEIRERLGGLIVVKADSLDEAVTLAHGCPAIDAGGSVEVRPLF